MRTNDEIIDLLAELKEEKGLSLSELARRVGMAKSGLSRYFNKTRKFPLHKVEAFAEVLGVKVEYILGFHEATSISPISNPNWTSEDNIQRQLEALLDATHEKGNFVAYGGKRPKDMSVEEFEDHILLKNALQETLRIAKKINEEKHAP